MRTPKQLTALVLAAAMATTAIATPAEAKTFADVPKSHWAYDNIDHISDAEIMVGYGGTKNFGPENHLLRAEFAGILQKVSGEKTDNHKKDTTGLTDMKKGGMWYTDAANWAYGKNLIKGIDVGNDIIFAPMQSVTREQAACIMQRYAEIYGADAKSYTETAEKQFSDWKNVSDWAKDGVEWAVERNLFDGTTDKYGNRYLEPQRPVLRAEMAKMVTYLQEVVKNGMCNIDIDGDGKPDINIDTDGDGKPDVNIDKDGDGKPDLNVDTNGDGKPDLNIDTNGDGKPDKNIDKDGDGKVDHRPSTPIPDATATMTVPDSVYAKTPVNIIVKGSYIDEIIWTFIDKDGKVYTEKDLKAKLNNKGGSVTFPVKGEWTIKGEVIGDNGKKINLEQKITVHEAAAIAFSLPEIAHTDTTITVEPRVEGARDVTWTVKHNGKDIALKDAFNGTLSNNGGEITFKTAGEYELIGTVTDSAGKKMSATQKCSVYPVGEIKIQADKMTHVDEITNVGLSLKNAEKTTVKWLVYKGTPTTGTLVTEEQVKGLAELNNEGGELGFIEKGTYTIVASITDETGREWKDTSTITSYPVGEVGFSIPEYIHTDEKLHLKAIFENLGDNTPRWTVKVDGLEKQFTEVFDKTPIADGDYDLKPKMSGDIEIKVSFTDAAGREYSDTQHTHIYPVPKVEYSLPSDTWTDKQIAVNVTTTGLDNNKIEWLVDNTYGYQDWNTYIDGTMNNEGGTIRFKRAGTYEIVARVTDSTGRVFLFELPNTTTIVQPVLDLTFNLPEETYVGEQHKVRTKGDNGFLPVSWTLERNGQEVVLADYMSGALNALGGDVSFTKDGNYTLKATMTDVNGRIFKAQDSIVVHPNVVFDIDVNGNDGSGGEIKKHLGEKFEINVNAENVDGAKVEWEVFDEQNHKLEWDDVIDGDLGLNGGEIAFNNEEGNYIIKATVTDAYGKSTTHNIEITAYNEAPSKPVINTSVDLHDNQDAFSNNAKVKGQVTLNANDAWKDDKISYEWDQTQEVQSLTGYYGLGQHKGKVRSVDQWGAKSEWQDVVIDVQMAEPQAPTVTPTVDYNDMQGAFTLDAKVKVTFDVQNQADPQLTRATMSTKDGYFGLGEHTVTTTVTDIFNRTHENSSNFSVVNEAPKAPTVTLKADYNDVQNEFSKQAAVKVTAIGTAGQDRDATKLEWASDSATTNQGAYLGIGSHIIKVRTVDAFGAVSDWTTKTTNIGVVGQADPNGTVYQTPTSTLKSPDLNNNDATTNNNVKFNVTSNAVTPVQVRTIDYYHQTTKTTNPNVNQGQQTTAITQHYDNGRHLLVSEVRDLFGNCSYGNQFFIVGSTTAGGGANISSQTTSIAEAGVFDGDTALAYINGFTFDIPSIFGHSSGGADWVTITGIKLDGSEEQIIHFNSSDGYADVDAANGKGTWRSDQGSGNFNYPQDTYVKLKFVYYNDHPGCLANATEGLNYTVKYKFRDDSGLHENFGNLFKW